MFGASLGLNWGTPFLLLAIYGLARYFIKQPDQKPNKINWTPIETVAITVAVYFVSQIIGGLLIYAIPLMMGQSAQQISDWTDSNALGQFLLVLSVEAVTTGMLFYFLKRRSASFKTIGLKKPRWLDVPYIFLGYGLYFSSYLLILAVATKLIPGLDTNQQQQIGFEHAAGAQLVLVFAALVVLPPIVEELMVRGFLYSGLKKGLPMIWAVLLTSTLFAAAHLQPGSGAPLLWMAAIDTFVLSLVLIFLKEKTGGLAAPIGLHMLKNFIAFMGIFVFHII